MTCHLQLSVRCLSQARKQESLVGEGKPEWVGDFIKLEWVGYWIRLEWVGDQKSTVREMTEKGVGRGSIRGSVSKSLWWLLRR